MNDEWAAGASLFHYVETVSLDESDNPGSVSDTSIEAGVGVFVMNSARFDLNFYFNGVGVKRGSYEQFTGQGGIGLSLEIQIYHPVI